MKVSLILYFTIFTYFSIASGSTSQPQIESNHPIVEPSTRYSQVNVTPIGSDDSVLRENGNQSSGLVYFPSGSRVGFCVTSELLECKNLNLEYRLVIYNHYVNSSVISDKIEKFAVNSDCKNIYNWNLPKIDPGFYYAVCSVFDEKTVICSRVFTFAVDLDSYFPPLERPIDFNEFWDKQDKLLKDVSPNPSLKLISSPDNPNKTYDVTMDLPYGHKVRAFLFIPKKIGKGPTVLSSIGSVDTIVRDACTPGFHPAGDLSWCPSRLRDGVHLIIALDEASSFTGWKSPVENDLLRCIQGYLRGVDFLASMPEVDPKNIFVSGASRGGPLAFIAAARRAENISGLSITIPTSAGISWKEKPYRGWGMMQYAGVSYPSGIDERLMVPLKSFPPDYMKKFTMMNGYVDPVNHAQDVIAPMVISYAIDDPLSPPQGIEAMYQYSHSVWKRISRDSGIHYVAPGFLNIQDELVTHLLNKSTGENNL
jgi:cephalosporin-C deacetylase-like acetyl esterase